MVDWLCRDLTSVAGRDHSRACDGAGRQHSARFFEDMYAVHRVTLWTCRILTLRLGEANGVRVGGLKDLNDGTVSERPDVLVGARPEL